MVIESGNSNETIGGTTTAAANLISGNTNYGIEVNGATTTGNVIENNYVGTGAGGSGTLLNGSDALGITNGAAVLVSGSFTGNVINQGSLSTANGPAIITITGNYTENSAALLNIQVAGTSAFDQLHVSGTATLDGTLNLSLLNSFLPDPSETFAIVSAGTVSGTYTPGSNPSYSGRPLFSTQYGSTALTLQGTTIIVNSTGDSGKQGSTPHTGNTIGGNPEITLRGAIQYADTLSGTSYIDFDIPTSDASYSSAQRRLLDHRAELGPADYQPKRRSRCLDPAGLQHPPGYPTQRHQRRHRCYGPEPHGQ